MSNVDPALLWLLGILVAFMASLVGVIYYTVVKAQDKSDERLEKAKDEAEETHRRLYGEINELKAMVARFDTKHQVLCQHHEDVMEAQTKTIAKHEGQLGRYSYTIAELDARVRNLDGKPTSLIK